MEKPRSARAPGIADWARDPIAGPSPPIAGPRQEALSAMGPRWPAIESPRVPDWALYIYSNIYIKNVPNIDKNRIVNKMRRIVNKMGRIVNKIGRIVNKMRRIVNKMGRIVNKTLTSILILYFSLCILYIKYT